MATLDVSGTFPDGTSVGAYKIDTQPSDSRSAPSGSAVATATVTSGNATFTGLTEDQSYYVIGQVSGVWRRSGFTVNEQPQALLVNGSEVATPASVATAVAAEASTRAFVDSSLAAYQNVLLSSPFNVKQSTYGARGDGTTNDRTAIQAAIDAADAAGGGTVYFPHGTYVIGSTLNMKSNVDLVGAGRDATILKKNFSGDLIRFRGTASVTGHLTYAGARDLTLQGNSNTGSLIEAVYADNLRLRDLFLVGNNGKGIDFVEVWDSVVDNVVCDAVNSATDYAINIRSSSAASGFGSSNDTSNVIRIINCRCEAFRAGAIYVDLGVSAGSTGSPNHIWIENFKAESGYVRGVPIYIAGGNLVEMDNIYVYMHSFDAGFSTPQYAIRADGLGIQGSIRDCHIGNSDATISSGIYVWNGTPMLLENIVGVYTSAPTTGKHIELAGGGPYVLREPLRGVNATYDVYSAAGVQRRPDKPLTPASATYQIASAATISPSPGAPFAEVSGTTTITSMTATHPGHIITLKFLGILTFTDGSNLKLGSNFVTSADDTITLVCDGTNWFEVARSAN